MAAALQEQREELAAAVREAAQSGAPLTVVGGGSKAFLGPQAAGPALSTLSLSGILAYEPRELVVTAGGGTRIDELDAALASEGQVLGFEPPRFAAGATLGGTIAAGLSGPCRPWRGAVRDQLLGVEIIDGRGRCLRFGGEVMKNVAGYDVTRLMCGGFGTLGIVVAASVRLSPRPPAEATLVFEMDGTAARETLVRWTRTALPLSGTFYHAGRLWLRLSGSHEAIDVARRDLGGDVASHDLWADVRDQRHAFFELEAGDTLWRLSVPPAAPWPGDTEPAGRWAIEWAGALRWLASAAPPEQVHATAARLGGHARCFRGSDAARRIPPLSPALLALHRALKQIFDPAGILNRGWLGTER